MVTIEYRDGKDTYAEESCEEIIELLRMSGSLVSELEHEDDFVQESDEETEEDEEDSND